MEARKACYMEARKACYMEARKACYMEARKAITQYQVLYTIGGGAWNEGVC